MKFAQRYIVDSEQLVLHRQDLLTAIYASFRLSLWHCYITDESLKHQLFVSCSATNGQHGTNLSVT